MRFRLLRRRLTISAPRMLVRSALPWPFRWAVAALVLGFCAAMGLWAFEFGRAIAGFDGGSKEELLRTHAELATLRAEVMSLREARDKAQAVADTAGTLATADKATQSALLGQIKQLEANNRQLRSDLGVFEKLIPASGEDGVAVRGIQAELVSARQLKWQVVLIQPQKTAPEFSGSLEVSFGGTQNGKPWSAVMPGSPQTVKFQKMGRTQGVLELPPQVVVKTVTARVLVGSAVKATQSIKI